jgi:hypothetical protein
MALGGLSFVLDSTEILLNILVPLAWFFSQTFIKISEWLSSLELMSIKMSADSWTLIIFSLFIILAILYKEKQNEKKIAYCLNSNLDR